MSENTQNNTPKKEQYSLNDDRRVKVLSPGALVAKRFFRNRLAVVGLTMLLAMFVFSFIGGVVSPYGQDQQFYTYTQMSKEYVGVTRNDKLRFVVADGQEFGSIAQSKGNEAIKKGEETFTYKDNDYEVETLNEDLYVFRQGRTVLAYASKDMVTAADGVTLHGYLYDEGSDVTVEYDKLIDRQLERAAVTTISGFAKVFKDASRVLEVKK